MITNIIIKIINIEIRLIEHFIKLHIIQTNHMNHLSFINYNYSTLWFILIDINYYNFSNLLFYLYIIFVSKYLSIYVHIDLHIQIELTSSK